MPRSALRHPELDSRDALALGLVLYRDRIGSRISGAEIGDVFGWDRSTGSRALVRLHEEGLLDADGAPTPAALSMEGGFLKVRTEHVREHGKGEALVLAQLPSLPSLHITQMKEGLLELPARLLADLIGCCVDTARDTLQRLSTGKTTVVKRALEAGHKVVVKPLIKLVRAIGAASRVRLLGERERPPASPPPRPVAASKPATTTTEKAYVPTMAELAAMMSAASAQRRS